MLQELFGEYVVEYGGTKVGRLSVSGEGLMVRFSCECVVVTTDILRLAILCENRYVVLGVLLPDGDKLRFTKRYSKNDLRMRGLSAIHSCRLLSRRDALFTETAEPNPPSSVPTPQEEPAMPILTPTANPIPATPDFIIETMAPPPEPAIQVLAPAPPPEPESEPELPAPISEPIIEILAPEMEPEPTPEPETPPPPSEPEAEPLQDPIPPLHWESIRDLDDSTLYTHTARVTAEEAPVADADLEDIDPFPISEQEMAVPPWTPHPDPGLLFTDPDLTAACTTISEAKTRPCGDDCIELAVLFESGKPFSLMPIFCLGQAGEIDGRSHLIFRIKNGTIDSSI